MDGTPGDPTLTDPAPEELRSKLAEDAPNLWREFGALAVGWTAPALERLSSSRSHAGYPKTFNDPVWGTVELLPWETVLLDAPLLQRLRGVRQLGMAHLVYPGAGHDRLEHSRGVVEAAERMIRALERNAAHRRRFGRDSDEHVPAVSDQDRCATRLAALLHDIGHGPFSHATERLIEARHASEFRRANDVLRDYFEGVGSIAPSETIATFIILSEAMNEVLTHPGLGTAVPAPLDLPVAIAARVLGSRSCLDAGYLSGIISGPVDADKLDYMARDSYHAGLPLGIDLTRLISKLEVVVVTPENAPEPQLRERAEQSPSRRFYDMGISQAGLGSYEQLIIARVLLYDRLYYHHKVRAAESMLQRLIRLAEEERDTRFSLEALFSATSDDVLLGIIGGEIEMPVGPGVEPDPAALVSGGEWSRTMARAIRERRIHYRAYAFAARFIAVLDGLPHQEEQNTRAHIWKGPLRKLRTAEGCQVVANEIHDKAIKLAEVIPDLAEPANDLGPEEILVDLPFNNVVAHGGNILTRSDGGYIGTPNLFFDPERWSQAYEVQKQCGFVFTPRSRVPLVALASRIVFFEAFGLVMTEQADRASKTVDVVRYEWLTAARDNGLCSAECAEVLHGGRPRLIWFQGEDLILPEDWRTEEPDAGDRIATEINDCLRTGLPASFHEAVAATIRDLASFADIIEKGGTWNSSEDLPEAALQAKLRDHLRSRGTTVTEGAEMGGGETDLVLYDRIVVENKIRRGKTRDPFEAGAHYAWQARRYSRALCSKVVFVVLGYRPSDETAVPPLSHRIRASALREEQENICQVRVVVPWGMGNPSSARKPKDNHSVPE